MISDSVTKMRMCVVGVTVSSFLFFFGFFLFWEGWVNGGGLMRTDFAFSSRGKRERCVWVALAWVVTLVLPP